jgi:23S rRNA pseudouridine1911/1915/1917 synthase
LVQRGLARSRRHARRLIEHRKVLVNGRYLDKSAPVVAGDDIRVSEAEQTPVLRPNPSLHIEAIYQDDSVLLVNKPGLIHCHPLRPDELDTLMNGVVAKYPEVATAGDKPLEGGLVHRLDQGTSGALIIARDVRAFVATRRAIRRGEVVRRYLALCVGTITEPIEIATPIAHHPKNPRKMITLPSTAHRIPKARPAATLLRPVRNFRGFSLIEVQPRTGCRHQVRVHLSALGHPLVGDVLYGGPEIAELRPGRFWLHLSQVALHSPSGGWIERNAVLFPELEASLNRIASA